MKNLTYAAMERCNADLFTYDVEQKGWEHEAKGLEFNLKHTLFELVRARRKDFYDQTIIKNELAPDAMQYALRIARWTDFDHHLTPPGVDIDEAVNEIATRMKTPDIHIAAWANSEILLADFVHGLDHQRDRETKFESKFRDLPKVSQSLMRFAEVSAIEYGFQPETVFHQRLDNLRERHINK